MLGYRHLVNPGFKSSTWRTKVSVSPSKNGQKFSTTSLPSLKRSWTGTKKGMLHSPYCIYSTTCTGKKLRTPATSVPSGLVVAAFLPEHLRQRPVLGGIYYLFVCAIPQVCFVIFPLADSPPLKAKGLPSDILGQSTVNFRSRWLLWQKRLTVTCS